MQLQRSFNAASTHLLRSFTAASPHCVNAAQAAFAAPYAAAYALSPAACHSFTAELSSLVCVALGGAVEELDAGRLAAWEGLPVLKMNAQYKGLPVRSLLPLWCQQKIELQRERDVSQFYVCALSPLPIACNCGGYSKCTTLHVIKCKMTCSVCSWLMHAWTPFNASDLTCPPTTDGTLVTFRARCIWADGEWKECMLRE
jgi:hypothetical protein